MKTLLLSFVIVFSSTIAFAQWDYSNANDEFQESTLMNSLRRQKIVDHHILSKKAFSSEKKEDQGTKKERPISEIKYDTAGYLLEIISYSKSGKVLSKSISTHDDLGRDTGYSFFRKKNKFIFKLTYSYDSFGNKTDERYFWKRPDNLTWHVISVFDTNQNSIERKVLTDNDKKLWERYTYSYFDDGSKKQTIQYNRKGKASHTWDFVCNPNGKTLDKSSKDTSKICVRYETDQNGNKIKVKEELVKHGKVCRTIEKFDINNNYLEWIGYDKNNKIRYHNKATYDGKSNETEFVIFRGASDKIKRRVVYTYDQDGNMTEEVVYTKSSMPHHFTRFAYVTAK